MGDDEIGTPSLPGLVCHWSGQGKRNESLKTVMTNRGAVYRLLPDEHGDIITS